MGERDRPDYKEPWLSTTIRIWSVWFASACGATSARASTASSSPANGVEALEVLTEKKDIDIVLSDINMPKMDGLTLLQQIPEGNTDLRSVIVSAYGDMENIRTAMNRGAFDFVTKPIDFTDLEVTIERTLRHLDEWRAALASQRQAGGDTERARCGDEDPAVDPAGQVSPCRRV